ncbi:MAG: Asp-tRNA(Asn)/Glu-tRNA(Gln) amidotransferase subunit GatB [Pseudomonadota bacterium]
MATASLVAQNNDWEMVIGLEIHAQLITQTKLFSGASASYGGEVNSHVNFVDAGMPGMLPVLNQACIDQAIRVGLGLNAEINTYSRFDRKNYFYPDLPQGYQISQFTYPIIGPGAVMIDLPDGQSREVRIRRAHLEQDAGKSIHDQHDRYSFVDLNRCGVPLLEIVSEPDLFSAQQAAALVQKLRSILRYLDACDGNMEQGSLRCDVNLSMRRAGEEMGTRTETKNMNSIRQIVAAIEHESRRQIALLENGEAVIQETRLWDAARGETRSMRSKEDAHDYRYFPDPDLLAVRIKPARIDAVRAELPELPDAKQQRFCDAFGLSSYDAAVLVASRERAVFYESVLAEGIDPKLAANWVITELLGALNKQERPLSESPVDALMLRELLEFLAKGVISGRMAKDVFAQMMSSGKPAKTLIKELGLEQLNDRDEITAVIGQVLQAHREQLAAYRGGKDKLFGFFVGQVMKQTQGRANPGLVNEVLKEKLKGH